MMSFLGLVEQQIKTTGSGQSPPKIYPSFVGSRAWWFIFILFVFSFYLTKLLVKKKLFGIHSFQIFFKQYPEFILDELLLFIIIQIRVVRFLAQM